MILEDLIEELNSFGRFQIILCCIAASPKMVMAWSMVIPSFAGVTPDWWCISDQYTHLGTRAGGEYNYKMCARKDYPDCTRVYTDTMTTAVSEWDLVCDKRLISKTIMSVQMAGVLTGVILAGQLADTFGRRKVYFICLGLHMVFNFICAFSISWQMYAVFRFLIGLSIGAFLGTNFPHLMEFMGSKWRPVLTALPLWPIGVACFSLFAYLCPNWRYLHTAAGSLTAPFLLGWYFVPESLRWLTVKGRVDEAEAVVDQIVKYNKRSKPADTRARLEQVALEELAQNEEKTRDTAISIRSGDGSCSRRRYCLLLFAPLEISEDVSHGKHQYNIINWFSCSVMYYGMTFGVSGSSGNLYLNMFLLTIVEVPGFVSTYWLTNIFGRKWTVFGFLLVAGVSMVATIGVNMLVNESYRGFLVNILALVGKFGVGAGWMVMYLHTNELYPTVIRSLGFGVSQTAARIGGIVAPMMLLMDEDNIVIPYVGMGVMLLVSCGCLILLPETKDRPLNDLLKDCELGTTVEVDAKMTDPNTKDVFEVRPVQESLTAETSIHDQNAVIKASGNTKDVFGVEPVKERPTVERDIQDQNDANKASETSEMSIPNKEIATMENVETVENGIQDQNDVNKASGTAEMSILTIETRTKENVEDGCS